MKKAGVYYLVDGGVNSSRYPDYHKIDIRVDRQFIFQGWSLTAYLDLWNVYNRPNIISYSFRAEPDGGITETPRYDFGIMPIVGMTANF